MSLCQSVPVPSVAEARNGVALPRACSTSRPLLTVRRPVLRRCRKMLLPSTEDAVRPNYLELLGHGNGADPSVDGLHEVLLSVDLKTHKHIGCVA